MKVFKPACVAAVATAAAVAAQVDMWQLPELTAVVCHDLRLLHAALANTVKTYAAQHQVLVMCRPLQRAAFWVYWLGCIYLLVAQLLHHLTG